MNKVIRSLAVLVATVVLSVLIGRAVYSQQNKPRPVPLTAVVRESFARSPETGFTKLEYKIVAVRGDGSSAEVRDVQSPDGKMYTQQMIVDLQAGERRLYDGLTGSRTTYRIPAETLQRMRTARKVCTGVNDAALLGVQVLKEVSHPAQGKESTEQVTVTAFRAPEWDCLALKEVRETERNGGPRWTTNLREVLSVAPGEPEAKWFEIPANAIERSPSEVLAEYERRYGERGAVSKTREMLDENYRKFGSR